MCCVTLARATFNDLVHVPHPSFVIPIFRAPTTLSTTIKSTPKLLSTLLRHEQIDFFQTTTTTKTMINQQTFENLILTNTIVAAFCIVLMITLAGFLLFLLIPSIRRRWASGKEKNIEKKAEDISQLSPQSSFHHFTLGPSRLNPIFEPTTTATPATATTTTTTQFGTLFHPTTTATTLLHPTFWTQLTPTSLLSATPIPQPPTQTSSNPPTPSLRHHQSSTPASISSPPTPPQQQHQQQQTSSISNSISSKPPLPAHPPMTTTVKSMRKR